MRSGNYLTKVSYCGENICAGVIKSGVFNGEPIVIEQLTQCVAHGGQYGGCKLDNVPLKIGILHIKHALWYDA